MRPRIKTIRRPCEYRSGLLLLVLGAWSCRPAAENASEASKQTANIPGTALLVLDGSEGDSPKDSPWYAVAARHQSPFGARGAAGVEQDRVRTLWYPQVGVASGDADQVVIDRVMAQLAYEVGQQAVAHLGVLAIGSKAAVVARRIAEDANTRWPSLKMRVASVVASVCAAGGSEANDGGNAGVWPSGVEPRRFAGNDRATAVVDFLQASEFLSFAKQEPTVAAVRAFVPDVAAPAKELVSNMTPPAVPGVQQLPMVDDQLKLAPYLPPTQLDLARALQKYQRWIEARHSSKWGPAKRIYFGVGTDRTLIIAAALKFGFVVQADFEAQAVAFNTVNTALLAASDSVAQYGGWRAQLGGDYSTSRLASLAPYVADPQLLAPSTWQWWNREFDPTSHSNWPKINSVDDNVFGEFNPVTHQGAWEHLRNLARAQRIQAYQVDWYKDKEPLKRLLQALSELAKDGYRLGVIDADNMLPAITPNFFEHPRILLDMWSFFLEHAAALIDQDTLWWSDSSVGFRNADTYDGRYLYYSLLLRGGPPQDSPPDLECAAKLLFERGARIVTLQSASAQSTASLSSPMVMQPVTCQQLADSNLADPKYEYKPID